MVTTQQLKHSTSLPHHSHMVCCLTTGEHYCKELQGITLQWSEANTGNTTIHTTKPPHTTPTFHSPITTPAVRLRPAESLIGRSPAVAPSPPSWAVPHRVPQSAPTQQVAAAAWCYSVSAPLTAPALPHTRGPQVRQRRVMMG